MNFKTLELTQLQVCQRVGMVWSEGDVEGWVWGTIKMEMSNQITDFMNTKKLLNNYQNKLLNSFFLIWEKS